MIDILKTRINQGYQAIRDIRKATVNEMFRGLPELNDKICNLCNQCVEVCSTKAVSTNPLKIDIGKCVLCGDCENECQNKSIKFTNYHKLASTSRESLIIDGNITKENYRNLAIKSAKQIKRLFGNSLKLRNISAAGCNGCEMELNACSNVNFDMGRFGIDIVASPRHADGIVITGPISENMAKAVEDCYLSTPEPKLIILMGACAISGGVFSSSEAINRSFIDKHHVDLYIPGCPVHPLTFINGILDYLSGF